MNKTTPAHPNGVDLDIAGNAKERCKVDLPYPTVKLIGGLIVECTECGRRDYITTTGRRDDPRSVTIACQKTALSRGCKNIL
jgi:hypothetical protein